MIYPANSDNPAGNRRAYLHRSADGAGAGHVLLSFSAFNFGIHATVDQSAWSTCLWVDLMVKH